MCRLLCMTEAVLPRHLRGFDLLGAKSGATAGETALGPPRLDAKAFLKPAGQTAGTPARERRQESMGVTAGETATHSQ